MPCHDILYVLLVQFREAGAATDTAAEAAALKLARKAARKAEKARMEEQKALAAVRAAADSRQMAAAEAEREAEEAARLRAWWASVHGSAVSVNVVADGHIVYMRRAL